MLYLFLHHFQSLRIDRKACELLHDMPAKHRDLVVVTRQQENEPGCAWADAVNQSRKLCVIGKLRQGVVDQINKESRFALFTSKKT